MQYKQLSAFPEKFYGVPPLVPTRQRVPIRRMKQPSIIDKYQHTEGVANFEVASDFTITIKKIYSCLKN